MANADDSGAGLTELPEWQVLTEHARELRSQRIRSLFEADDQRFERFSVAHGDLLLDFSKNLATQTTLEHLFALARRRDLDGWTVSLFRGAPVNTTEHRAALHMALRNRDGVMDAGSGDVMPAVERERQRMRQLVERLHSGTYRGSTGRPITDVVNIGVGGSDLGAVMATEALAAYRTDAVRVHFVSSIDGVHITDVLQQLAPETTLFVISSKSFTTLETMTNAEAARDWLRSRIAEPDALAQHLLAVSTSEQAMADFGIPEANRFRIWDWVGGRYSLTSAVGLPAAIALGMDHFEALLTGCREMDQHFRSAPMAANLPVIMGLLGVWHTNFLDAQAHAILPYDQRLHRFPAYLQQLEMESNGKRVTRHGTPVDYHTGPVVWGEVGPNAQHSFYQLLHQGTRTVTVDFLVPVHGSGAYPQQHRLAVANCLAQSRALMEGQDAEQVRAEMTGIGASAEAVETAVPHKVHPGNKSSNTLMFHRLDPTTLGRLVALYEHKVFVQSVIWGINPFDQWGVELGKKLAKELIPAVTAGADPPAGIDGSTRGLLDMLHRRD